MKALGKSVFRSVRLLVLAVLLVVGLFVVLIPLLAYIGTIKSVIPLWASITLVLSALLVYPLNARYIHIHNWVLHVLYGLMIFFLPMAVASLIGFELPALDETGCDNLARAPADFVMWGVLALPYVFYAWGTVVALIPEWIGKKRGDSYIFFYVSSLLAMLPSLALFVMVGVSARTCEAGLH